MGSLGGQRGPSRDEAQAQADQLATELGEGWRGVVSEDADGLGWGAVSGQVTVLPLWRGGLRIFEAATACDDREAWSATGDTPAAAMQALLVVVAQRVKICGRALTGVLAAASTGGVPMSGVVGELRTRAAFAIADGGEVALDPRTLLALLDALDRTDEERQRLAGSEARHRHAMDEGLAKIQRALGIEGAPALTSDALAARIVEMQGVWTDTTTELARIFPAINRVTGASRVPTTIATLADELTALRGQAAAGFVAWAEQTLKALALGPLDMLIIESNADEAGRDRGLDAMAAHLRDVGRFGVLVESGKAKVVRLDVKGLQDALLNAAEKLRAAARELGDDPRILAAAERAEVAVKSSWVVQS